MDDQLRYRFGNRQIQVGHEPGTALDVPVLHRALSGPSVDNPYFTSDNSGGYPDNDPGTLRFALRNSVAIDATLKIHLGCGDKRLPGFVHVDARPGEGIDYVAYAHDLPFEDNSADLIYWSHGIEHLKVDELEPALNEFHRVLKPRAILRLAVPDFQAIANLYANYGVHLNRIIGLLYGRQNYEENFHYSTWDFETLAEVLRARMFYDVRPYDPHAVNPQGYHDISYATITVSTGQTIVVSLNIEALKIP